MKALYLLMLFAVIAPVAAADTKPPAPQTAPPVIKASFDCATAKGRINLLICGDADLAALDVQEAQMLRRAQIRAAQPEAVNVEQDVWLGQRNACTSVACLSRAYRRRLHELQAWTN
jgi:uncharacterized protein